MIEPAYIVLRSEDYKELTQELSDTKEELRDLLENMDSKLEAAISRKLEDLDRQSEAYREFKETAERAIREYNSRPWWDRIFGDAKIRIW